jgi:hypothetical protein
MSILYINTGTGPNAGDGDSLRLAFTKINSNFRDISNTLLTNLVDTDILSSGRYPLNDQGRVSLRVNNSQSPSFIVSNYVRDLRPEVMLRGWGTATAYISELASGTASTATAVTTGSVIGSFLAGGYDGSRWSSDRNIFPGGLYFTAAETWSSTTATSTNAGTNFELNVHPPGIHLSTDTHQTIISTVWDPAGRDAPPQLTINFGNADDSTAPLINSQSLATYNGMGGTNLHFHHTRPTFFGVVGGSISFVGSIQGNLLTVNRITNSPYKISIGSTLLNYPANSVITGTQIVSFLSGSGGTGTYLVNIAQSVSTSTITMVSADNGSLGGTNYITIDAARRSGIVGKRFALKQNDTIGGISFRGQIYDNSSFAGTYVGNIRWEAREDFTGNRYGSRAYISTSNIGTRTTSYRLLLDNQQNQYRSALHVFNGAGNYRSNATITSAGPNSELDPISFFNLREIDNYACNLIINTNNGEGPGGEIVLHTGLNQGISLRANINQDVLTLTTASVISHIHHLPSEDLTYDLGSELKQWRNLYIRRGGIYVDGTPFIGGAAVSDTPPDNPTTGELWYNTDTGRLYVRYDTNWIDASPAGGGGGGGNITYNVAAVFQDSVPPGSANSSTLWYDTVGGRSYVYYNEAWIDANPPNAGISVTTPPLHSTSTGFIGNIAYDSTYMYVCVGTSTWKRVNLASDW